MVGAPDRRTAVPVEVTVLRENRTLKIEPGADIRDIVSTVGSNGVTTFAASPGRRATPERLRRARLAQVSALLRQLASCLGPLVAEGEEPGIATRARMV
jgi:hypothetical protein